MPTYTIRHSTTYRYRQPVAFGEHRLMLRPRPGFDQRIVAAAVSIEPEPATLSWSEDPSGNMVGVARFGRRSRTLRFVAEAEVEQALFDESRLRIADHARSAPFSYGAEAMPDLARFIERQHADPTHAVDRWARAMLAEDGDAHTWTFLKRLNARIRRDLAYLRREAAGIQAPVETLRLGSGTCRDFAVLMAEALRALGFATRFVSGYLHVGPHRDAFGATSHGHTHAWLQVYLPDAGWIDFDPTSGGVGNAGLVRVALVRNPADAAPLVGAFIGFPSDFLTMEVEVAVAERASSEAPRVAAQQRLA